MDSQSKISSKTEIGPPEIASRLVRDFGWSEEQLRLGLRAQFRCEYCDKNLLKCVDNYFWIWQIDHIKPLSRNGRDEEVNMAVSCLTCNLIKRDWWENRLDGIIKRDERIKEVRKYVTATRESRSAFLKEMKELISRLEKSHEGSIP